MRSDWMKVMLEEVERKRAEEEEHALPIQPAAEAEAKEMPKPTDEAQSR